ncbi:hypothetical protein [Mycobacterium aquaticum]|uniref:Haemophore haem-binding domain-containing protein n=1 Tax=Mycobacterium aquaticum TaxID=1927124 RepID=A0A1X0B5L8_9MYCO|nr:hypothetical protein [Mycobacterium aquaticum]ORA37634.1 hypothetical protein BST13_07255 [Mycobacterium aquaticum]
MIFATTSKLVCAAAAVTALLCAGCGAAGDSAEPSAGAAGGGSAAASAPGGSSVSDFCTLDAKLVARKLRDLNSAFGSGAADQNQIVDDLLKDAPVTQSELVAAAPAEPRRFLEDLADPDKLDAMVDNMKALNDWAIQNCDAKYRPLFEAQAKYVG